MSDRGDVPSHPDFNDDDIPTGVHHLPPGSQVWATSLTKDVRKMKPMVEEIHTDFKAGIVVLKTLRWALPTSVAAAVGLVELLSWLAQHVKL